MSIWKYDWKHMRKKPHICLLDRRFIKGKIFPAFWRCSNGDWNGYGPTPRAAYKDWLFKEKYNATLCKSVNER